MAFQRGFKHALEESNLCFLENLKRCYGMVVVINLIQKNVFFLTQINQAITFENWLEISE